MKKCICLALFTLAAPTALFADIAEARNAFERECAGPFARSVLVDYMLAPDAARYDKAPGKASYTFALPYRNDSRMRFINATFDSGKFVEAKIRVLGFDPKPIDAKAFGELRETFPMVSVREGTEDVNPTAVLYPARVKKSAFVYRHNAYSNLNDNPVAYFLGVLGTSVARVGTSTGKLAYQVKFVKDGLTVDLGIATGKDPITQMLYFEKTREALEKNDPSRKGMVSERDMVDFRDGAMFTYTAVPFPKKE